MKDIATVIFHFCRIVSIIIRALGMEHLQESCAAEEAGEAGEAGGPYFPNVVSNLP